MLATCADAAHPRAAMNVQITSHGLARDPGKPSDDATEVRQRDGKIIAVLADGLGSSREGGQAARRAVAMLADHYLARPQTWSPRRALSEFAAQINRVFHQESQLRHGSPELLCTLTAAAIEGGRLYGLNIGDSPALLWRHGKLSALTHSHALTQPGMEHVLSRALGLEPQVEPHFFETAVEPGDVLLLCSDGVSSFLPETTLATLLSRRAGARSIVTEAHNHALENDEPPDDATAIVLDITTVADTGAPQSRTLEFLPEPKPGDTLDRYRLVRPLRDGAPVWLAETPDGARHVLKFPPQEARDDEVRRDAFVREMWQATRVQSPDFVPATIPAEGTLRYYVMDYVDAPTLREVLRAAPLAVEETVALGQFLLRAAQFLLADDRAHGDIKPDNILVLRTPGAPTRYLMLDLGSAAEIFSVTSRAGTPSYLAPERFRGGALSERTEIYAIGVTLYEALTRAYPYGEVERFQTPRFETTPKRPTRLNPATPPWLESIVLRAITADPEHRQQSFSEMAYELAHPDQVTPFYRKDAPLLERNPLLFYKITSLLFLLTTLVLLARLVALSR